MAPGLFVRELACLGSDIEPLRRGAARVRGCDRYRRLDTDGLATHFYSQSDGTASALLSAASEDLWLPAEPARPVELMSALGARGRLPPDLPVYNTEAGFQSHPIRRPLLAAKAQAFELNMAEFLQWRTPGIASFAQYLLNDDPVWFSGLRYHDGSPKLALYSFRMPIMVRGRAAATSASGAPASDGGEDGRCRSGATGCRCCRPCAPTTPTATSRPTCPRAGWGRLFQLSDGLLGTRSRAMSALPQSAARRLSAADG